MRAGALVLVVLALTGCAARAPAATETERVDLEIGVSHTLDVTGAGSSVWAAGAAAAEVSCAREHRGQGPVALVGHFTRDPREVPVVREGHEWHRVGVIDREGEVTVRCEGPAGTRLQALLVVSRGPGQ